MEAFIVIFTLTLLVVSCIASWLCLTQLDPPPIRGERLKLRRLSDDVTMIYHSPK